MWKDKSTFWVVFGLTAGAAFLPLLLVLVFFYGELGLPLLGGVIAAFVLVALPAAVGVTRLLTQPWAKAAVIARRLELDSSMDEIQAQLDLMQQLDGPKELTLLIDAVDRIADMLQQQLEQLNTIYQIGQTMTNTIEYEEALRAVLAAVGNIVQYDAAEVIVADGRRLIAEVWRGEEGLIDTTGRLYRLGQGLVGMIAKRKTSILMAVVDDVGDLNIKRTLAVGSIEAEMLHRSEQIRIDSFLGIPLLIEDELIGVITLVHREKNHFSERDQKRLEQLAAQASIAINNAMQLRNRERTLRLQIRDLQIRVDEARRSQEIDEVANTAYFQELREQAHSLRLKSRRLRDENAEQESRQDR